MDVRLQLTSDIASVLLPPCSEKSAVAPEAGLRQILIAQQDETLVVGAFGTSGEQLPNFIDAQIVKTVAVQLLEQVRIIDADDLPGRGELAEVRDEGIPKLPTGIAESDANSGTARAFNQIGGLVTGSRQIHGASPQSVTRHVRPLGQHRHRKIGHVEQATLAALRARAERGRRILGTPSVGDNDDSQVAGTDGIEDLDGSAELASVEPEADRIGD